MTCPHLNLKKAVVNSHFDSKEQLQIVVSVYCEDCKATWSLFGAALQVTTEIGEKIVHELFGEREIG